MHLRAQVACSINNMCVDQNLPPPPPLRPRTQPLPLGKIKGLGGKLGAALAEHHGCATAGAVQGLPLEVLVQLTGSAERARCVLV